MVIYGCLGLNNRTWIIRKVAGSEFVFFNCKSPKLKNNYNIFVITFSYYKVNFVN